MSLFPNFTMEEDELKDVVTGVGLEVASSLGHPDPEIMGVTELIVADEGKEWKCTIDFKIKPIVSESVIMEIKFEVGYWFVPFDKMYIKAQTYLDGEPFGLPLQSEYVMDHASEKNWSGVLSSLQMVIPDDKC